MSRESEGLKYGGDAISASLVLLTLAEWLPSIAAIVSIIWGVIRIWETRTVQRMLGRDAPSE